MDKMLEQDIKVLEKLLKRCGHEANYRRELGQRDWASEHEREGQTLRRCISFINAQLTLRLTNEQRRKSKNV
jgi:hypothetical protein